MDKSLASLGSAPVGDAVLRRLDRRPTILVIDSDLRRRGELSWMIAGRGFAVTTARGGEEALVRIAKGGVALAVSSVEMPGMDGLELLRIMGERRPAIPLIAIATGDRAIDQVYLRSAELLGAVRSFTWPLLESAFMDSIGSLLQFA